jgi:hypothetical protein
MTMNANDLFNAVMQLDLEPIKMKLMHVQSGEGWSQEKADAVEKEYRRFLCLMKMYPDEDTAPLVDVDTFWHYHILDTMKYAADCERVFGYFLHHYPYVGMGADDEQFRLDSGQRMAELYEATFGETYPGADAAFCASPHAPDIKADTAFCASPHGKDVAFCASPHTRDIKADTAFCASPHGKDVAFCASPHTRDIKADTAFCASPHGKDTAAGAGPRIPARAA